MITQKEFLERLVRFLDRAGIPYMVAGSMSSSLHGRPRATQDADVVIDPTEDIILSKLEWMKGRESEIQYSDALGVAVTQWGNLDLEYLRQWAGQLGVENVLARLLKEAREQVERTN